MSQIVRRRSEQKRRDREKGKNGRKKEKSRSTYLSYTSSVTFAQIQNTIFMYKIKFFLERLNRILTDNYLDYLLFSLDENKYQTSVN